MIVFFYRFIIYFFIHLFFFALKLHYRASTVKARPPVGHGSLCAIRVDVVILNEALKGNIIIKDYFVWSLECAIVKLIGGMYSFICFPFMFSFSFSYFFITFFVLSILFIYLFFDCCHACDKLFIVK